MGETGIVVRHQGSHRDELMQFYPHFSGVCMECLSIVDSIRSPESRVDLKLDRMFCAFVILSMVDFEGAARNVSSATDIAE